MNRKLANQSKLKYVAAGMVILVVNLVGEAVEVSASSDADYSFIIDSDWHTCQQLNPEYQDVYAFETPSYHINICQQDQMYFYAGEAKQNDRQDSSKTLQNSIFMPAEPLENYRGFQAVNGNVTYLVLLPFSAPTEPSTNHPGEAILTIRRNGQLVSVESSLEKYCDRSKAIAFEAIDSINLNLQDVNQLATTSQPAQSSEQLFLSPSHKLSATTNFNSNARFDFYYIDGKLHRLTTCDEESAS